MGMPSLNDLVVDGTLNTTDQPTNMYMYVKGAHIDHVDNHLVSFDKT